MPDDNLMDSVKRYLKDAIAAESSFETQLRGFANEGDNQEVRALFRQHADETHSQIERLTARLKELGDSPSAVKSFMAHMFGMAPKTASMGHDEAERVTQNLMMAYTVEHAEMAMYESLATVAEAVGDHQTTSLAREIQQEEEATARKVWPLIAVAARQSVAKLASEMTR